MFPRELRVPAETANSFKAREAARPRALRPDPEQTFVASERMARFGRVGDAVALGLRMSVPAALLMTRGQERLCNPRRHPVLQKAAGGDNLRLTGASVRRISA
jgi:hypothetical protein